MLELLGLSNVGEFYSQHYLETLLSGDIKAQVSQWKAREAEGGPKAPPRRLGLLHELFFRSASRASGERALLPRLEAARELHAALLDALGYTRAPGVESLGPDASGKERVVPVVASLLHERKPLLWVVEAPFAESLDSAAPLHERPYPEQLPHDLATPELSAQLPEATWSELLDGPLLRSEGAPRWVMLLAGSEVLLIDKHKWPQGKYLRFDLSILMSRREPHMLDAMAGLLHREVLVPQGGPSLLDQLDEKSHKHAFGVSTDLKHGIQQAIEILANEALYYRRTVSKENVFSTPGLAEKLGTECIIYLYRLLFLFYVEARGEEAGVVHMGDGAYRSGYSLESLRDLEQVPLTTLEARQGTFIQQSLDKLFKLVQHGYRPRQRALSMHSGGTQGGFVIEPLRSQLFDAERTPILGAVKRRNEALQKVLALLSLSAPKRGQQRGRISYAQLGINQLGAVYEGLLSYQSFLAPDEVIELRAEGEEGSQSYFVPSSRKAEFDEKLIVSDARGVQMVYPKGTFLFRMAGRDREKSASYYTPEVLTECLTRYTLKERLGEPGKPGALTADEILQLTVCEPAMGSGAFMNEAINQLAEAYLTRKQQELGQTLPAEDYAREKQKLKFHFAVHNAYGVDLNPLAGELGKVSLWLNCLYPGAQAPYLDLRIATGNSLIGARRQVFTRQDLTRKSAKESWLSLTSRPVPLSQARPDDAVYHFLVPDQGMAPADADKVLAKLYPSEAKQVKAWRKAFCAPFTDKEVERLLALSARVDTLWQRHLEQRQEVLHKTRRTLALWGQPEPSKPIAPEDAQTCEEHARKLLDPNAPGERLGRVMDYWCALWFWPLSEARHLPTRAAFLSELERLTEPGAAHGEALPPERARVLEGVRKRQRFFHWELRFAEVFAERGGMDIILGNPPWRKVEWQEADVLADFDAALAVQKLSAKQWADRRNKLLEDAAARSVFMAEAEEAAGTQAFLNAVQNYPLLRGVQTNLYKCFMTRSWELGSDAGMVGLLHQQGAFDDPKGGSLREALAPRARLLSQCKNQLKLFSEVHHERPFALSISAARPSTSVRFVLISNLFHPRTLDESFAHDGVGEVPGIKTDAGEWDLRGHRSRLVPIDEETLALFARLYDAPGTPAREARLPVVHSREILQALKRFLGSPKLESREWFHVYDHLDESRQQKDGTICRKTAFPSDASEWIVSGPHFHVGTPFNKTPNEDCKHNQDYSVLDLTQIADDYLPRTNYVRATSLKAWGERIPRWRGRPATDYFRHIHRRMLAPTGERTLIAALIPQDAAHLHTCVSVMMSSSKDLLALAGMTASVPVDFFVKSSGKSDLTADGAAQLPLPEPGPVREALILRALRLNCLTTHYAPLWEELFKPEFTQDAPTTDDPRAGVYTELTPQWQRSVALRTAFARRQALCEIDALAALSLGMTLEELLLIYRVQFPVLQQYERETYYDQRGKIVFTVNKGLNGVGLDRKQWTELKDAQAGDHEKPTWPAWAHDAQGPYEPPFTLSDREADMAQAYRVFAKRFGL